MPQTDFTSAKTSIKNAFIQYVDDVLVDFGDKSALDWLLKPNYEPPEPSFHVPEQL